MIERFDAYVERCLYDPASGFYAQHGEAGRARGDFVTSVEVGPLFGAVLARAIDGWWHELGRPERFTIVEAGAGRGALAAAVLAAEPACLEHGTYVTVERSERLRHAQRELLGDRVRICADLHEVGAGIDGVVIANELLDNLPFRLAVRDDVGWGEVFLVDGVPTLGALDPTTVSLPEAPVGTRLPMCEAAHDWVSSALALLGTGRVVVVDYGVTRTLELAGRDWLRTYRDHRRGADPFEAPGRTDITCDIPIDQLPAGATVVTQAEFLRRWGIDELVDEGRRIWQERAHLGDLDALRARSRVTESAALLDASSLGGFLVVEWVRGTGTAPPAHPR